MKPNTITKVKFMLTILEKNHSGSEHISWISGSEKNHSGSTSDNTAVYGTVRLNFTAPHVQTLLNVLTLHLSTILPFCSELYLTAQKQL